MRNAGHGAGDAEHQFDAAVNQDKPFGLDRHRQEKQENPVVRPHDPVSQQQSEYTAGSANGRIETAFNLLHQQLDDARSNDAGGIKNSESLAAPGSLQRCTKHPYRKHVEKQVIETTMKKAVAHQLPWPEKATVKGPQCEFR